MSTGEIIIAGMLAALIALQLRKSQAIENRLEMIRLMVDAAKVRVTGK